MARHRPCSVTAAAAALAAGAAATAAAPSAALAGPLGFSHPVVVGDAPAEDVAAALGPRGAAVLVAPGAGEVRVLRRVPGAGGFVTSTPSRGVTAVRAPQAAVGPDGTAVAAWAEHRGRGRRGRGRVVLLRAAPGRTPVLRRFAVASAWSAGPRVAVLPGGTVLLAWRSAGRLLVSRDGGAPRVLATGVASLALTRAGGGAVLGWTRSARPGRPRTAVTVKLGRAGRPIPQVAGDRGRPLTVSRDAGALLRLAGAPDGRVLASWVRPRRGARPEAAFTRLLWPAHRAAQPVRLRAGERVRGVPVATLVGEGLHLLAVRAFGDRPFGARTLSFRARAGSSWDVLREHGGPAPVTGVPRPVISGEDELVVWSSARRDGGYDVLAARRVDGDSSPAANAGAAIGRGLATRDGAGVAVAGDGPRVLVAWPAAGGGVAVAERS